ncbi:MULTISPECIES: hypothetical protein [Streptomyces]|uniref:hypothetical protein n=1 Tax=Streptomyces lycopersici TaxID=2974589 RepID=UPI0021D1D6EA|nr:hypothetical protein [Streptomyces sp. NEAU-383]
MEHAAVSGPPPGIELAGHLIAVVVAARLLGITERVLWRGEALLMAGRTLLRIVWPLTRTAACTVRSGRRATGHGGRRRPFRSG